MTKSGIILLSLSLFLTASCETSHHKQSSADAAGAAAPPPSNTQGDTGEFANEQAAVPVQEADGQPKVPVPELYKRFHDARRNHQARAANEAAVEIFARNPNNTRVLNSLAVMAMEQGKYELARLLLGKVFAKEPDNPAAINNLGVIELKTDNLRVALIQFKRAIEVDGNNSAAHANLGTIYLQYRNYQNAAAELQSAVDHGDQSPETLSNLGFALRGIGDFNRAEGAYEKALAKDENNTEIMLNYATLLVEHKNDPKKALKFLNKIRFVAREPGIMERASALAREAEGGPKGNSGTPSPVEKSEDF